MTRAKKISAFVAMGLLMTATTVAAQKAPVTTSGGEVTVRTLGIGGPSVGSSKFTEYREVPEGASIPFLSLYSSGGKVDFTMTGYNLMQSDQRLLGRVKAGGMSLKFNWNEIPHDMGNSARTLFNEPARGVWELSNDLQLVLQNALNAKLPTSTRTYDFYSAQLAPTFASANVFDVSGTRKTGNVELNLGNRLPAEVTLSYKNESKMGYRGLGSVNFRAAVSPSLEVANPLDEITQDFGLRAAKNFKSGNVYASVNRNVYNNRAETMMIDFPWQAVDAVRVPAAGSVPETGANSRERFIMAPDNEATTTSAGFLLKLKRQTRVSGSFALSNRTQDAPFYPYTANTAVTTPAGVSAATVAALQRSSYGGKVNTTSFNLAFSSMPMEGLALRARYNVYDLADKSNKFPITGDMSQARASWDVVTPTVDSPYGHVTGNIYDTKSSRFSASAAYDIRALTLEGEVRNGKLERTFREAEKGTENGYALTAMFHVNEWMGLRGTYDVGKRTAEGETIYGFQQDEAAFTNTRTGFDIELTPTDALEFSVAYFRRHVEYTDRPDRRAVASGVPVPGVAPFPNTPSGALYNNYDSYTGEISYTPNARVELDAYYTYEKDAQANQWSTTTGTAPNITLNNLLRYAQTDKLNTYGANVVFHVVPDKRTLTINAMKHLMDGLMDITAREAGSFYTPGRTTLIPAGQGGAADIGDWDDAELTTFSAQFDVALAKGWTMSTGYMYEKYDWRDAFNATNKLLPSAVNIFTKPNDGAYSASILFAQLGYKF